MYFPQIFHNLINFSYQRHGLEVVAFYITYLIGIIICGAIIGTLVATLFGGDQVRVDWKVDVITASIIVLLVTHFIVKKKNLDKKNPLFRFIPLLAAIASQFLTPAIALIIPTWLSMQPKNNLIDTKIPTSGNDGANEDVAKKQQMEDIPPPTPLGDAR